MKYGESIFDILYLLFALAAGILLLVRGRTSAGRKMGCAALILSGGDAFHLVPRVLDYFVKADFTAALGVGKLITSVTMTVFYVLLYLIYLDHFDIKENRKVTWTVYLLSIVRIALCLFPQNHWLENESDPLWGIIRNVPFALLGALVAVLFFCVRNQSRPLRFVWLYVTLSFLFYLPVAVAAGLLPILGMLMLPKTVCYILLIAAFLISNREVDNAD